MDWNEVISLDENGLKVVTPLFIETGALQQYSQGIRGARRYDFGRDARCVCVVQRMEWIDSERDYSMSTVSPFQKRSALSRDCTWEYPQCLLKMSAGLLSPGM